MDKIPLKVFLLGMIWTVCLSMAPVGVMLVYWLQHWDDAPDWNMFAQVFVTCAIGAVVAYWRKYKALLALPPSLEMARELATQVKTVTTTEMVEHQTHPTATVTTTVEQTTVGTGKDQITK